MFRVPLLPRTLAACLRDLHADKATARVAAVRQLVAHADADRVAVVKGVVGALRDPASAVRAAAATAVADLGATEAMPDLLVAMEDEDVLVRQLAISAVGEIGDARATERLRRALRDPRPEVRFQAVIAFPRVAASSEDAVEVVLRATEDEDPIVCHIALRMGEEIAGEALDRFRNRARTLLEHSVPEVRVASAILVAHGRDPRALTILVQVARGELRTREHEDEAAAIELAGELTLREAEGGLERRAFGGVLGFRQDPYAFHARVALARMGHERACREILRELSATDRDRCTLAVAAAGRARLMEAQSTLVKMRDGLRVDVHAVDEALALLATARSLPPGGETTP